MLGDPTPAEAATALELEIARGRLQAIVDEAGAVLVRTAFSQLVREAKDFACALLTPGGRTIVQATGVPVFMGTTAHTAQELLALTPASEWRPGVVIGTNDIWLGTGHLYDLTMVTPVFFDDAIVALTSVVVHLPDIGGRGWGREARQVFEEGLRIPPTRLGTTEGFDPLLAKLIAANVRLPEQVAGDMDAGLNASKSMGDQLIAFCEEMAPEPLEAVWRPLEERTERFVRSRIAEIPDGVYRSSFDSDEAGGLSFHLQLELTVHGELLEADFAGSSSQVPAGINSSLAYTRSYLVFALKCLLAPDLPLNEGLNRVIGVGAPRASVVNSAFPAAGTARNLVGMHIPALVFNSLATVLPEAVTAESGAPHPILSITGAESETGALFSASLEAPGGFGARASCDGGSVVQFPANTQIMAVEMIEATSPLLFRCRELLTDSGGAGRFRGGLGQRVAFSILAPTAYAALHVERLENPACGLFGGEAGSRARVLLGDAEVTEPAQAIALTPTDVLTIESPGGGGYGEPQARDADATRWDVTEGYVSEAAARTTYGLAAEKVRSAQERPPKGMSCG